MTQPLKTFIIYARDDAAFKNELLLQLHALVKKDLIKKWDDTHLLPGEEWEKRILEELAASDLVIMLVSANSLYSDFIQKKELKAALEQRHAGVTRVIPILVRDCLWEQEVELSALQMLPREPNGDVIPVTSWKDSHAAWAAACRELIKLVHEIHEKIAALAEITAREQAETIAANAEKEKKRLKRLAQQDEAAWEATLAEVAVTDDIVKKIAIFRVYFSEDAYTLHKEEAETQITILEGKQEQRLRIAAKIAEDARRIAEEEAARLAWVETEKRRREKEATILIALEAEKRRKEEEAALLLAIEAEKRRKEERLAAIEAEKRKKEEAEAARLAAIEAEKRKKEEEAARLAAIEAEKRKKEAEAARLAAIEAEKRKKEAEAARLAALEAEKRKKEAEAARLAALEAEKRKKEAEAARLAAIEAEKRRKESEAARLAAIEVEKRKKEVEAARLAALEAEKQRRKAEVDRIAALEAERRKKEAERLAAIEAEKRRPKNGHTIRDAPNLPEMVFVEGGTFQMGSNDRINETPIHTVTLIGYYIGKYPVTFEEYDLFCTATKRIIPADEGWRGSGSDYGERPVININFIDAQAYCDWIAQKTGKKYRLLTEAEWEFAARGGTDSKGFVYAGSNNLEEAGWFQANAGAKIKPVGARKANELGIFDMSGNVWEWCRDWYGDYPFDNQSNPTGPKLGEYRVYRGGSWFNKAESCRITSRGNNRPVNRGYNVGFRLARSL